MVMNANVSAALLSRAAPGEHATAHVDEDCVVQCFDGSPNKRHFGLIPPGRHFVLVDGNGRILGHDTVDLVNKIKEDFEDVRNENKALQETVAVLYTDKNTLQATVATLQNDMVRQDDRIKRLEDDNKILKEDNEILKAIAKSQEAENRDLKKSLGNAASVAWAALLVAVGACCLSPRAAYLVLPAAACVAAAWRR